MKGLDPEKGTEEESGEGSWLWLSLKRPITIYLEASCSTKYAMCHVGNFRHEEGVAMLRKMS